MAVNVAVAVSVAAAAAATCTTMADEGQLRRDEAKH